MIKKLYCNSQGSLLLETSLWPQYRLIEVEFIATDTQQYRLAFYRLSELKEVKPQELPLYLNKKYKSEKFLGMFKK